MQTALNIARLHIQLTLKDRSALVTLLLVPIILMTLIGFAIGNDIASVTLRLDVWDADQSTFSQEFIQELQRTSQATDTLVLCVYGAKDIPDKCNLNASDRFEDKGETRLTDRITSAALVIPSGFGSLIESGQPAQIEFRSDNQLNTQTVSQTAVTEALDRYIGSLSIATIGTQIGAEQFSAYDTDAQRLVAFDTLRQAAKITLQTPAAIVNRESTDEEDVVGLGASQSVPGMGSMFVLFGLLSLAQTLVDERKLGTLQRLFTIPTPRFYIVLGKILGAFFFGLLQFAIFVMYGWLVLKVEWGQDYLALALLISAFCLAGTALGFALATLVKTSDQASGLATMIGLILAPLGGAWWPLEIVPPFMRTIGHISPIAWAMDGFTELIHYNGGLVDILPMLGALMLTTAILMAFATWRFRYE